MGDCVNAFFRYCLLFVLLIVFFYVVTLTIVDSLRLQKQSKLTFDSCAKFRVYETGHWLLFIN